MKRDEAITYLYELSSLGWKLGLDKVRRMLADLGNPHEKYKSIHVAGTNGKGSTSSIAEAILRESGYVTGLFTSPHLINVNERIRINGVELEMDALIEYIHRLKPYIDKYKCTFFEAMTAIGFLAFAEHNIDVAIVEVGLGGRLDATNVINPSVAIITDIEHDHTNLLGRSRKLIAAEKGGIIKKNLKVLTASRYRDVLKTLREICLEQNAELIRLHKLVNIENTVLKPEYNSFDLIYPDEEFRELKLALIGAHQIQNASLAITAVRELRDELTKIDRDAIYRALGSVRWPGRLEVLADAPVTVVDVAHNPDAIRKTLEAVKQIFTYRRLIVLIGIVKKKNYRAMLKELSRDADMMVAVKPDTHRALNPVAISKRARELNIPVKTFDTTAEGLEYALGSSGSNDLVLGVGSHYTVGEILKKMRSL
ncbi:MAG: folylpolyglutamate synthase/dihydrofolate synthase family protein [candidate division KSB1 bacterium]|jgi:dihydrofolate synthase/folylpolyglutamate synthase|nr:folylpolyglutamate synthase/dihydrofolate synthase family protein [candidate division KSB1 bacterium]